MYDLTTLGCYSSEVGTDHHCGNIQDLAISSDGKCLASASSDGEIKLWDVVCNRVCNAMTKAHSGHSVNTVKWSRNLRYLVSAGTDGKAKLWDVRKGGQVGVCFVFFCLY